MCGVLFNKRRLNSNAREINSSRSWKKMAKMNKTKEEIVILCKQLYDYSLSKEILNSVMSK